MSDGIARGTRTMMYKPNIHPKKAYRLKNEPCPNCGIILGKITKADANGNKDYPDPGDLTLCFECGTPFVFDRKLRRKPITEKVFLRLSPNNKELLNKCLEFWKKDRESLRPNGAMVLERDSLKSNFDT